MAGASMVGEAGIWILLACAAFAADIGLSCEFISKWRHIWVERGHHRLTYTHTGELVNSQVSLRDGLVFMMRHREASIIVAVVLLGLLAIKESVSFVATIAISLAVAFGVGEIQRLNQLLTDENLPTVGYGLMGALIVSEWLLRSLWISFGTIALWTLVS